VIEAPRDLHNRLIHLPPDFVLSIGSNKKNVSLISGHEWILKTGRDGPEIWGLLIVTWRISDRYLRNH